MEKNKEILLNWGKKIEKIPKLKFELAKKIYLEYLNEENLSKKERKREELILGTLHVVYNYILRNNLDILNSSFYDMDDIISICNKYFINELDNGVLLKVNCFSNIFTSTFFTALTNELIPDKELIKNSIPFEGTYEFFSDILYEMIRKMKDGKEISYKEFSNLVTELENDRIVYSLSNTYSSAYKLILEIISTIDIDNINFSKTKLNDLKYLLIHSTLELSLKNQDEKIYNQEEMIINKMFCDEILKLIIPNKDLRDFDIIAQRFGLFDYDRCHTLEEVAKDKNVTKERIRQIEAKMLRKFRMNRDLKNYVKGEIE